MRHSTTEPISVMFVLSYICNKKSSTTYPQFYLYPLAKFFTHAILLNVATATKTII